ncbi:MAG TPA: hypothetical protein VMD97_02085 [Candidatus Aquilonibacter sp.]|nr:hypothetical protein [Candidatus Aquilonibacter sp.]
MAKRTQPETHLLLPDMHFPDYHRGLWRALLNFMERSRVDGVTWMGDQLSLDEISHHNQDKPGLKGKGALRANLDAFAVLLDDVDARLPKGAVKRWHYGNHERFVQDLYDASPELEGMVDLEEHLGLERRGYEIFKLGEMSELGNLGVIHGDQVGSGKYVANKLVEAYCQCIVMGHVHTASSIAKVAAANARRKWIGWTLPTMGTVKPAYARNRVNPHLNGFGIVELMRDGQFNMYTIIADSGTGSFSYGGQFYCGKAR